MAKLNPLSDDLKKCFPATDTGCSSAANCTDGLVCCLGTYLD